VALPQLVEERARQRAEVLRSLGADEGEIAALLLRTERLVDPAATLPSLPLADEPFVAWWEGALADAGPGAVERLVRGRLGRPIEPLRGRVDGALAATPGGRLPSLHALERADFEALVRAFRRRGRSDAAQPVAAAMGAILVSGLPNPERAAAAKRRLGAGFLAELAAPPPDEYEDLLLVLSDGPYAGVSGARFGLDEAAWRAGSLALRIAHEGTHYLLRRACGSRGHGIADELLADFAGLHAALGRYRAAEAMAVLSPRLSIYRGQLTEQGLALVARLAERAAQSLERASEGVQPGALVLAAAGASVEEWIGEAGAARLAERARPR
jgi:hypothetical protein